MDAFIRYDPNKAEVSPMKEPLRWICNEAFHDLKRRVDPGFSNTREDDSRLAFIAGGVSAVGAAESLKYELLPRIHDAIYAASGRNFDLNDAILTGFTALMAFNFWYFRQTRPRAGYLDEHNVYANGVRGVIVGAVSTALAEMFFNSPRCMDFAYGTLDAVSKLD